MPPPRPAAQQQRLALLLLSVARLDVGAMHTAHIEQPELKVKAPPEAVRLAISLVHQPASEGEAATTDAKPVSDGSLLKARAAMFGGVGGGVKAASQADDLGKLETLVEQKTSAAALATLPKGLLWRSSWSALQLPGEEAALVLLQLVHPDAAKKGGSRLVGWVALSAQACLSPPHTPPHPPHTRAPSPPPRRRRRRARTHRSTHTGSTYVQDISPMYPRTSPLYLPAGVRRAPRAAAPAAAAQVRRRGARSRQGAAGHLAALRGQRGGHGQPGSLRGKPSPKPYPYPYPYPDPKPYPYPYPKPYP